MARVVFTALADQDTAEILATITRAAGYPIAEKYSARFHAFYTRLVRHPTSCQVRPQLGALIRVGVVMPYLVIYRCDASDDTVGIIRILHGNRRVSRRLLRLL